MYVYKLLIPIDGSVDFNKLGSLTDATLCREKETNEATETQRICRKLENKKKKGREREAEIESDCLCMAGEISAKKI